MTRHPSLVATRWGLPVLWLWRREPEPPPVTVVVVVVYVGGDPALRAATAHGIGMTPRKALPPGGPATRKEMR